MPELAYFELPINADEGFPQSFRLDFGDSFYTFALYVSVPEEELVAVPDDGYFELGAVPDGVVRSQHAFLVMRVTRESANGPRVIFFRKVVPNLAYDVVELSFWFSRIHVAKQNINGVGAFGSVVEGRVASR
jgi:hypothetical protein